MKKVAIAMLLAVSVMAQEPAKAPDLRLNELETTRWTNIQLQGEVIQARIKELNAAMTQLQQQLVELNRLVVDSRKLDPKEYEIRWQATPPVVAKRQPPPAETAKK